MDIASDSKRRSSGQDSSDELIHHEIVAVAEKCANGQLSGVDSITLALISAFDQMLCEYEGAEDKSVKRDLNGILNKQLSFLSHGKPFPSAIGAWIRLFKHEINSLPEICPQQTAKTGLRKWLWELADVKLVLAAEAISGPSPSVDDRSRFHAILLQRFMTASKLLTYSWCPLIERALLNVHKEHPDVHITILDHLPTQKGKGLLKILCKSKVDCTYGLISAAAHLVPNVDLVVLGCSAILSNGKALVTPGTSQVAMHAQANNIPVLVAAPTYRFVDKVEARPEELTGNSCLMTERNEVMSADLITAIVCELRLLPPSSVPAVLRAKQQ